MVHVVDLPTEFGADDVSKYSPEQFEHIGGMNYVACLQILLISELVEKELLSTVTDFSI